MSKIESSRPRLSETLLIVLVIFVITGINIQRTEKKSSEPLNEYSMNSDFGFNFLVSLETVTIHTGVTEETASNDSGWYISKLDGDAKQYGIIWCKKEQIPANYSKDLDGFYDFFLDYVAKNGVIISEKEEMQDSSLGDHKTTEQLIWITESEVDTPVLIGWWLCEEKDLCVMVYSLMAQESGSFEDLNNLFMFYAENIQCCGDT